MSKETVKVKMVGGKIIRVTDHHDKPVPVLVKRLPNGLVIRVFNYDK